MRHIGGRVVELFLIPGAVRIPGFLNLSGPPILHAYRTPVFQLAP